MAEQDWCEHGGLPVSMCAHCRAARGALDIDFGELYAMAEAGLEQPRRTEALYSGTCRRCGARWEPGEPIELDEDEGAWCHARC